MKGSELRKVCISPTEILLLTGYDSSLYSRLLDLTDSSKYVHTEGEKPNSSLSVGLKDQYDRTSSKTRHFHAYYALKHLRSLPHFEERIFRVECNKQRMTLTECAIEGLVDKVFKIFILLDCRTGQPVSKSVQDSPEGIQKIQTKMVWDFESKVLDYCDLK